MCVRILRTCMVSSCVYGNSDMYGPTVCSALGYNNPEVIPLDVMAPHVGVGVLSPCD